MKFEDLFTAESLAEVRDRRAHAEAWGVPMFEEYVRDREAQLQSSSELDRWISALEEGELAEAAAPTLWSALVDQGFVITPTVGATRGDDAVFAIRVIAPQVLDAFRTAPPRRSTPSRPSRSVFAVMRVCPWGCHRRAGSRRR